MNFALMEKRERDCFSAETQWMHHLWSQVLEHENEYSGFHFSLAEYYEASHSVQT